MDKRLELSYKQRKFIDFYDGSNGTEAARQAGYSHPAVAASRLVATDKILKALQKRDVEQHGDRTLNRVQRLRWLTDVVNGKIDDVHVMPDGTAVKIPARLEQRLKALQTLCRACGDFVDRVRHEGADGQPLSIKIEFVGVGPVHPAPTAKATPEELLETDPAARPSLLIDFEPRQDELEPPL